jgi:S1-C subfamily serine protease
MTSKPIQPKISIQTALLIVACLLILVGAGVSSRRFGMSWTNFSEYFSQLRKPQSFATVAGEKVRVVSEESIIIDVIDRVSPSVVTVGISKTRNGQDIIQLDPYDLFSPFQRIPGKRQKIEQDIGSGFILTQDGMIVTNKHVVSDAEAKYRIITKNDKTYDVVKIYRDPVNDLAILKINATGLTPVEMGDSKKLKVGQTAIAIGTALGEFRNTVTTGVVSGVGRGITAGSSILGGSEKLNDVIQTSAAINPGNSGGPLLNSSGQVIGVNTAVSGEGQNIGFALPINVVKDALTQFNSTGQFNRAYLGVQYKAIAKSVALLNDVPVGMYVVDVVDGSPAANAGIETGDILTVVDGTKFSGTDGELAAVISRKRPGDTVQVKLWRDGKEMTLGVTLGTQE